MYTFEEISKVKKLSVADLKTIISNRYKNDRKKPYGERLRIYSSGKFFIESHVQNWSDYDECIKHLVDVLHI